MKRDIRFCNLAKINAPYKEEILRATERILCEGRFIGGEDIESFQTGLSAITGVRYTIGAGNGYDALKLILKAFILNKYLKAGDRVLVPVNTYIASVLAVVNAGLIPVPVDVDEDSMLMTAETIERTLRPNDKAIMPVHLYGRVTWDKDIKNLCIRHNLIVVEDNAQAIGAASTTTGMESDSNITGSLGHAAAFSFYPTKNIGAIGDGGAITTNITKIADSVRILGNYGSDRRFHNVLPGENSRLDNIQAAVVNCKLPDLQKTNRKRKRNARILDKKICSDVISKPYYSDNDRTMVWHQYVVKVRKGLRDPFRKHMAANGIETDIHYPELAFLQPCFKDTYVSQVESMNAKNLPYEIVSLPINQSLDEEDMIYISKTINTFNL